MCLIFFKVHRVTIEASHSRYLRPPGRVFNLCCSFVFDLNHSDQWNTLLSIGGEIFQLTNLATPLGNRDMYELFWSSSVLNSCLNPGSFSNSLQSDLLSDLVNLGLKLLDLFRSESFQPFMLYFYTQSISLYPDLVFFWLDLSFSLCFGFLQGTAHVLLARISATA